MEIGDKVIIRTDLVDNTEYGDAYWFDEMNEFLGKEMLITKIVTDCEYELDNNQEWVFTKEMFQNS